MDGSAPTARTFQFRSAVPLQGFYQWESNNGYCGEVSLMQSGLSLGQWSSQFNTRAIASPFAASIAQTGRSTSGINFYSQLLLDDEAPPSASGANSFANAATNLRLQAKAFNSAGQATGLAGYKAFMAWIKAEIVAGNYVTIGVMEEGVTLPYGHIVNVIGVDSNSPSSSLTYDGTDVMYIDDHGAYTTNDATYGSGSPENPAIPPGAGSTKGCTPYKYGYTFDAWQTRVTSTKTYQIPLPTGTDKNYGYSVSGVMDTAKVTLPVSLSMATANPMDPIVGYRYEVPFIGTSNEGNSNTNVAPAAMSIDFTVTVRGLTAGLAYNLYRYTTTRSPLPKGALNIPTSNFNANAGQANQTTAFTAVGATYTAYITIKSTDTMAYRCVPASAP